MWECADVDFSLSVMPGLVPGIHVPPPHRPLTAHAAMPQDVDARNKSGHDGGGTAASRQRDFPIASLPSI